jgi:phage shock protein C
MTSSPNPLKFERDVESRWLGGVCAGIARLFGIRPMVVRLLVVVATLFFFWIPAIAYLVLWAVLPGRVEALRLDPDTEAFWRGVATRPPAATAGDLGHRFRELDGRLQRLEAAVTSEAFQLKRRFREIE